MGHGSRNNISPHSEPRRRDIFPIPIARCPQPNHRLSSPALCRYLLLQAVLCQSLLLFAAVCCRLLQTTTINYLLSTITCQPSIIIDHLPTISHNYQRSTTNYQLTTWHGGGASPQSSWICMYIYIYILYIHTHTYIYICIGACVRIHIYIYTH